MHAGSVEERNTVHFAQTGTRRSRSFQPAPHCATGAPSHSGAVRCLPACLPPPPPPTASPPAVFEGWYFKVTLPGDGQSFALIYSVEDPSDNNKHSGVGAQVMGPDDGYLLQYSPRQVQQQFWADRSDLALGAVFKARGAQQRQQQQLASLRRPLPAAQFDAGVEQGFQASATWHQGSIVRAEAGAAGSLPSTVDSCRWAFSVRPVVGWGDAGGRQKATAGWLAALPVFEPHWQVVMAHGLASGWIEWGGKRYEFTDAAHYAVRAPERGSALLPDSLPARSACACLAPVVAGPPAPPARNATHCCQHITRAASPPAGPLTCLQEKNWGGGFPRRWCWVQCNTFEGEPGTSVTAVGALRGLLGVPGVEENVGMVGIHHRGR